MLTRRILAAAFIPAIFVWFFLCFIADSPSAEADLHWLFRKLGWENLLFPNIP
jgi:hypothetical protein